MPTATTEPVSATIDLAERLRAAGEHLRDGLNEYEAAHDALAKQLETFDEDSSQPMHFYNVKQLVEYIGESDSLSHAREAIPALLGDAHFAVGAARAAADAEEATKRGD